MVGSAVPVREVRDRPRWVPSAGQVSAR